MEREAKDAADDPVALPFDDEWDPTHTRGPHDFHWTTTNLGEAAPGVLTPLASSLWEWRTHRAAMRAGQTVGVFSRAEREAVPPPAEWVVRLFHGRVATRLEFMAGFGDRLPGITGAEAMQSLLGEVPETMRFSPTRRRYPIALTKLAMEFRASRKRMLATCARNDAWWREQVRVAPTLGLGEALRAIESGADAFEHAISDHLILIFAAVQPAFDAVERLVQRAGTGDLGVLCGAGGAEIAVVSDLWKASRGELDVTGVVANHGFHGPAEGEVSSRVWREDPTPLVQVIEHYRALTEDQAPEHVEAEKRRRIGAMSQAVLAAIPARERPGARLVLKVARERVPDRGRGKRAFLQGIDVTRMAARRAGELLAADGALDTADDVFFLTEAELVRGVPRDAKELVARRRERRALYQRYEFERNTWHGSPVIVERRANSDADRAKTGDVLVGKAASRGTVEGQVRVVYDPTFEDVEPGEILVASTTDPSWCSIMFVSAALVIDLGGMLSHAAVVAREIEIPCIVDTKDATARLRTGDRVRVDGTAGTIEVLARAAG